MFLFLPWSHLSLYYYFKYNWNYFSLPLSYIYSTTIALGRWGQEMLHPGTSYFRPHRCFIPLPFLFFCGEDIAMEELFLVDSLSIAMFSSQEVSFCLVPLGLFA